MRRKPTTQPIPQPPIAKLAYGVDEAAECLSISRSLLYVLIQDGKIPIVKAGGRTLVSHQAILDFLK